MATENHITEEPITVPEEIATEEHERPSFHDESLSIHEEEHEEHSTTQSPSSSSPEKRDVEAQADRPNLLRTTTTSSRRSVRKVPRSQRKGLFGRLTLLYEAEEPKDYPRPIKWWITSLIACAAVTAAMGSSIILPALPEIGDTFNTTPFVTNLSVAFYMLSMSLFPLWWSSYSETAGRRTVYLVSYIMYIICNILAAVSTNISMFIVFRVLSGGSSASVQAVGAGTIADIWPVAERGRAMGIFYLGPLAGPLFAPIIGGVLTAGLGWRSTQWFQTIYGVCVFLGILFFLPETHHIAPIIAEVEQEAASSAEKETQAALSRTVSQRSFKSAAVKSRKHLLLAKRIFIDPLKIITYLRFPPVALTVYYASIAFGCLYFLNISVESTFSGPPYNFGTIQVGLLYISNSLGYLVMSLLGGPWVDYIMKREARRANRVTSSGKLIYHTEDRLRENAWAGAVLMPLALIWYGWTSEKHVYWFVPILANFFYGCGSMLIFGAATTMLTEFMPKKASNGVALHNCLRNIFSFLGTLLAEPAIRGIGNGWLFTILGIVAACSCFVIPVMRKYGGKWRETMAREMD